MTTAEFKDQYGFSDQEAPYLAHARRELWDEAVEVFCFGVVVLALLGIVIVFS